MRTTVSNLMRRAPAFARIATRGEDEVGRKKGKKKTAPQRSGEQQYTVRVLNDPRTARTIRVARELERGQEVPLDGLRYKVAYVKNTDPKSAILHPPRRRPGRPRKEEK